jgi:hypothetical protein
LVEPAGRRRVDATATVAPGDGDGFLGRSRATQVGPRAAERWAPGDLIARGRWHRAGMRDRRFAFRARHLVLVLDPMFGRSRAVSRGHGRPPRFRREGEPLGPVLTDPRRQPRSSHAFTCTPLISFVIADDRYWTPRDRAPQAATCEGRTSADARFWESSSRVRDRALAAATASGAVACFHAKAAASSTGLARESSGRRPRGGAVESARSPRWPGAAAFGAGACNRAVVASVPARPGEPASRALATAGCCSGLPARRGLNPFGLAPGHARQGHLRRNRNSGLRKDQNYPLRARARQSARVQ